ncbi:hypothetical protein OKW46_002128 [Paraburkholderia sp. WSM4179]|nr:hypothetical protein [Paraburkholderia sp. WSM4179]
MQERHFISRDWVSVMFSFGIVHQGTDVACRVVREAGVTAAAFTLFAAAGHAQAASLPCRHSLSSSERLVCEDPELSSLDGQARDAPQPRQRSRTGQRRARGRPDASGEILPCSRAPRDCGYGRTVAGRRRWRLRRGPASGRARFDEIEHGRLAEPCRIAARAEPARLRPRTRNADALPDPHVPANGRGDSTTARTRHA